MALVYELHDDERDKTIYLLKGDENVLFILDNHRAFLVGDANWSYTLNRVRKVLHALPAR